jgi:Holliday junction resolvase RusA-like endonuclease
MSEGAVRVEIGAYMRPRVKRRGGPVDEWGGWMTKKPDVDNVAKLILDAGNGIFYRDDRQVVRLGVEKRVVQQDEEPGISVVVSYWREGR